VLPGMIELSRHQINLALRETLRSPAYDTLATVRPLVRALTGLLSRLLLPPAAQGAPRLTPRARGGGDGLLPPVCDRIVETEQHSKRLHTTRHPSAEV
jgi:hypothetical protein